MAIELTPTPLEEYKLADSGSSSVEADLDELRQARLDLAKQASSSNRAEFN